MGLRQKWGMGWGRSSGAALIAGLGFGRLGDGRERDLGGVEELGAVFWLDGAEEHAVADTCNEVTDVLMAGEWWHGQSVDYVGAALGGVQVQGFFRVPL